MYWAHKPCLRLIRGEPQSGSDLQPKVAAQRLPWGRVISELCNPNRVASVLVIKQTQPVGVVGILILLSQGSRCASTLGFGIVTASRLDAAITGSS